MESLAFELAHTLARETELVADRLERPRIAFEAEAQLEDAPLALGKSVESPPHALLAQRLLGLVERVDGLAVGEEIAQLTLVIGAHGLVERDGRLRGSERLVDVLDREAGRLRKLVLCRLAPELDFEPARGDVDGHADCACVVGDGSLHRLANPPGRVRGELEAPAPVELLDCAVEAEGSLLDQIEERNAEAPIALGDRDDQAEVRLDHDPLGAHVALLDPLRERDLLRGGQKLVAADVGEEELQAVARPLDWAGCNLDLLGRFVDGRTDLEPDRLQLVRELGDFVIAEVKLERERLELCRLDVAALFSAFNQGSTLDRVKKLMHRGVLGHVVSEIPFGKRSWTDGSNPIQRSDCRTNSLVRLHSNRPLNWVLTSLLRSCCAEFRLLQLQTSALPFGWRRCEPIPRRTRRATCRRHPARAPISR